MFHWFGVPYDLSTRATFSPWLTGSCLEPHNIFHLHIPLCYFTPKKEFFSMINPTYMYPWHYKYISLVPYTSKTQPPVHNNIKVMEISCREIDKWMWTVFFPTNFTKRLFKSFLFSIFKGGRGGKKRIHKIVSILECPHTCYTLFECTHSIMSRGYNVMKHETPCSF